MTLEGAERSLHNVLSFSICKHMNILMHILYFMTYKCYRKVILVDKFSQCVATVWKNVRAKTELMPALWICLINVYEMRKEKKLKFLLGSEHSQRLNTNPHRHTPTHKSVHLLLSFQLMSTQLKTSCLRVNQHRWPNSPGVKFAWVHKVILAILSHDYCSNFSWSTNTVHNG